MHSHPDYVQGYFPSFNEMPVDSHSVNLAQSTHLPSISEGEGEQNMPLRDPEGSNPMDVDLPEASAYRDPGTLADFTSRDGGIIPNVFAKFEEVEDLKLAADLFLVCQCHEDAFDIFASLYRRLRNNNDKNCSISIAFAIDGCARSARTSFQLTTVRVMLEETLSKYPPFDRCTSDSFLCELLLIEICNRQKDRSTRLPHNHATMRSFPRNRQSLSYAMHYYSLSRGLNSEKFPVAMKNIRNRLLC